LFVKNFAESNSPFKPLKSYTIKSSLYFSTNNFTPSTCPNLQATNNGVSKNLFLWSNFPPCKTRMRIDYNA
jgi:hypothetical protein